MKTVATTDWNALLESKCTAKTMKAFAEGDASTRSVTQKLANSEHAGEFRKLVTRKWHYLRSPLGPQGVALSWNARLKGEFNE